MALKLKYETGIATSIQFVVVTILNLIDGATSSVTQCSSGSGNCFGDIALALVYFVLISICFGVLWLVGFAAQDRRSKRIALFLIGGEGLVLLISLYNLTHHTTSLVNRVTSFADLVLSVWIAFLALRIIRAKGGRVRTRHRVVHKDSSKL